MKIIDIEKLPKKAQKELLDFYEFLLKKYKRKKVHKKIDGILPKKVKSFKPIKREDIYER
ncbi:MAG: DUF2281 domain-containing protein [Aquificae bacterium]|nr:DUF2281 domain-containing protein [Aquificota bacterium]